MIYMKRFLFCIIAVAFCSSANSQITEERMAYFAIEQYVKSYFDTTAKQFLYIEMLDDNQYCKKTVITCDDRFQVAKKKQCKCKPESEISSDYFGEEEEYYKFKLTFFFFEAFIKACVVAGDTIADIDEIKTVLYPYETRNLEIFNQQINEKKFA